MNRYLLFGGDVYYARGGMRDFIADFDDEFEAMRIAHIRVEEDIIEWWHIYDTYTMMRVQGTEQQAHGYD